MFTSDVALSYATMGNVQSPITEVWLFLTFSHWYKFTHCNVRLPKRKWVTLSFPLKHVYNTESHISFVPIRTNAVPWQKFRQCSQYSQYSLIHYDVILPWLKPACGFPFVLFHRTALAWWVNIELVTLTGRHSLILFLYYYFYYHHQCCCS